MARLSAENTQLRALVDELREAVTALLDATPAPYAVAVRFGDPSEGVYRKNAFDTGEFGGEMMEAGVKAYDANRPTNGLGILAGDLLGAQINAPSGLSSFSL